jgi:hypothetical protein
LEGRKAEADLLNFRYFNLAFPPTLLLSDNNAINTTDQSSIKPWRTSKLRFSNPLHCFERVWGHCGEAPRSTTSLTIAMSPCYLEHSPSGTNSILGTKLTLNRPPKLSMMTDKAGNPLDVAQLQEQLEEALKAQKQLQRQLDASRLMCPEKPKCYFLESIPIEVRNHIYEYLLVNPDLCSPAIFPASPYHEQIDRYYLSPSILGTCRQINDEAIPILYERNTFIVGFKRGCCPYSPISRIEGEIYGYTDLFQRPGFKKVKQWKVVLSVNKEDGFEAPIYDFVTFCRIISDNLPRSLKV